MAFASKLIARVIVAGAILLAIRHYLGGITLEGGLGGLAIAALLLALFHAFLKPLLKFVSAPLIWLTLGLFNVVIHVGLLWLADFLLPQLAFHDTFSLVSTAILLAVGMMII